MPKWASGDLLLRVLAYHTQVQPEGGLSKATRKRVARLADPWGNAGRPPRPASLRLKPGSRLIRLAFLSPKITEAILDGRQPLGLSATRLMQVSRLPLDLWVQKQALGFS